MFIPPQEPKKTGVLLINLGTPAAPNIKAVRKYLREFLNDPRVIELPTLLRWILVNIFILPFRPAKSAKAYQKIWQAEGSPLLLYSQKLQQTLAQQLGENYQVELGMRYGQPNLLTALRNLKSCNKILLLPLFPQYSSAVTGSALAECFKEIANWKTIPALAMQQEFYNHPGFINAFAKNIQTSVMNTQLDLILFSYHGLPQRQLQKSANTNIFDYRQQCLATSEAIAEALQLTPQDYQVAFQSRLGKTPWIKPYTDEVLAQLATQGIKRIAIVCPSFVTDCLETLEEIGIRAKQQWQQLGGEELILVPCLNHDPAWVDALQTMIYAME